MNEGRLISISQGRHNNFAFKDMLKYTKSLYALLFIIILSSESLQAHGLGKGTLVKKAREEYFAPIEQIVSEIESGHKIYVVSYDVVQQGYVEKRVKRAAFSESNCYCVLSFGDNSCLVECTPSQLFYRLDDAQWVQACMLCAGDSLLCDENQRITIEYVTLLYQSLDVYTIEVKDTHTFLISKYGIVTHNMLLPTVALGFSIPFNLGCGGASAGSVFGPIGVCGGIVFGGVIGCLVNACCTDNVQKYELYFQPKTIARLMEERLLEDEVKSNNKSGDESKIQNLPKAGGFPFVPGKTKDGKIPKNKNGAYLDKKGNAWKWDNRKNEWDVSNQDGHWNVNIHGEQTHKGTHPKAQSHTSKSYKRGT